MNLFSILEEAAKKWPYAIALADSQHCLPYRDLHVAAESLAMEMQRVGIKEGDKVALMLPKGVEDIVVCLAVMRAGGIVIPISSALKASEIVHLAEQMSADAFCYSSRFQSLIPEGQRRTVKDSIFKQSAPLYIQWAENRNTSQEERKQLLRLNAASIGFTSGTTSEGKGIILSHDTLLERARTESEIASMSRDDGILYLLSITYSLAPPIAAALLKGAKIVIADGMDMQALPRLVAQYSVTLLYASPLVYQMILNQDGIPIERLRGVRYLMTTGNSLPNTTAEEFYAKVGREIAQRYGLNECGPVFANLSEDASKRGSVGIPDRVEVKLESGDGALLEGEATGELLVRGPGLFEGYYRLWRLREEVLEDGWFRTGDIARRDEDGYYWIVGRVKDVINVGGVKVFPQELEEVLLSHPAVEEAVVYGVAEGRFGEVPHAKVRLRAGAKCTEREIMRHVNEKVSVFKSLRGVELVAEIPKTVTGKPRRTVVES